MWDSLTINIIIKVCVWLQNIWKRIIRLWFYERVCFVPDSVCACILLISKKKCNCKCVLCGVSHSWEPGNELFLRDLILVVECVCVWVIWVSTYLQNYHKMCHVLDPVCTCVLLIKKNNIMSLLDVITLLVAWFKLVIWEKYGLVLKLKPLWIAKKIVVAWIRNYPSVIIIIR